MKDTVNREDLRILWKQIAARHAFAYNPEYVNEGSLDALIEFGRIVGHLFKGKQTRGWGPWRAEWYSICSAHQRYDKGCERCEAGSWVNTWGLAVSHFVFRYWPRLWLWWANR